jgi:hypothetical protein
MYLTCALSAVLCIILVLMTWKKEKKNAISTK